jgi:SAM-dependent methyltransferase
MPGALNKLTEQLKPGSRAMGAFAYMRQQIAGIAQDYWKDGHWEKPDDLDHPGLPSAPKIFAPREPVIFEGQWQARPGEVSERMWGGCFTMPGEDAITDALADPLVLTSGKNILDLSAGLGGRAQKLAEKYGVTVAGLEADADVARRGMEISAGASRSRYVTVNPYDPLNFAVEGKYDCIIAREVFYRVPDKEKLIAAIIARCKEQAQVSFTDYVINAEDKAKPAIEAWRAFEPGADPVGLVDIAEIWAKNGISLRIHEDLTDLYRREIKLGLVRFTQFMATTPKPDAATKKEIGYRIALWANRMAALDAGMRFYRFYGQR